MNEITCEICGKRFPANQLILGHGIRHEIENLIRADHPGWTDNSRICKEDLFAYRNRYISGIIAEEKGSIEVLEDAVIKSIRENDIITYSSRAVSDQGTIGERISDKVASFGGSWKFIITFFSILLVWILVNGLYLMAAPFDPYPFILLNLVLSCIAAIQAPIIMMSQNRQEAKDRIRSENDYKINLKSEIEIRTLHEKVDHLLLDQWSKMMSIQEIQMEILEEIRQKIEK
ncbi:MAG: DUF1003 domain-containing protein [Bacteroidota bacterium]